MKTTRAHIENHNNTKRTQHPNTSHNENRTTHVKVYHCMRKMFPDDVMSARTVAGMCPKPISKQWGRKSGLENYVLSLDREHLQAVLKVVLGTRGYWAQQLQLEIENANEDPQTKQYEHKPTQYEDTTQHEQQHNTSTNAKQNNATTNTTHNDTKTK